MSIPTAKRLSTRDFSVLSAAEKLEHLSRSSSRQKLNLLLDVEDGPELLAQMPPQDLYLMARELGADQIPELLGMASPEQWTAFFDFDCWNGDQFDPREARAWLAVLLEIEAERVAEIIQELDFELLVLIVKHEVQVLSGPEDIADESERGEVVHRDGGYMLQYLDDDGAKLYGMLLDILLRTVPELYLTLLEAIRAEGLSMLEEDVFMQRGGRLLDQGLPARHEARSIFAWLDPEQFRAGAERKVPLGGSATGVAPGALLQLAPGRGVLGKALAEGVDAGTAWELSSLINKALVADGIDFSDLGQMREVVTRTHATLNLALEFLAGEDAQEVGRCLREEYAEQLHRLGFSLTLKLQRRARSLLVSASGAYLDRAERQLLDPLLQSRPQCPGTLDDAGRGGQRPFATLHDLRLVEAQLERMEAQRCLFEEHFPFVLPAPADWVLADCHPDSAEGLHLTTIFLTSLANRLLGRPFAPEPLAAAELAGIHALVSRDGRLDQALRKQTVAWLESLLPGGGAFGARCLDLWDEEFCAVPAGGLDPRYLGGLIVRLA